MPYPFVYHHRPPGGTRLEIVMWMINLVLCYSVTRYLFELNSEGIFFGWDGQSALAFLNERHRFSSTIFGPGSDPIIGLGNIAYPLNPIWFPSFALSKTQSGDIHGPLAFAIAA